MWDAAASGAHRPLVAAQQNPAEGALRRLTLSFTERWRFEFVAPALSCVYAHCRQMQPQPLGPGRPCELL